MTWPTPREPLSDFSDVEKFLRLSFEDLSDQLRTIEGKIVADDNGVTYEWVREHIDEKVLTLLTRIEQLEERVKELEDK
tara:strand:+ start:606 stop:842 length:237 start_codon:yes stop_codon:yes gene_type:complete